MCVIMARIGIYCWAESAQKMCELREAVRVLCLAFPGLVVKNDTVRGEKAMGKIDVIFSETFNTKRKRGANLYLKNNK